MLHRENLGTETYPFPNAICYAGWKAILLTWAWALAIWQIADFAKFLVSWVLQRAEDIWTECKHTEQPEPAWVKAVNLPGVVGDHLMRLAYKPIAVRLTTVQSWRDFVVCLLSSNSRDPAPSPSLVKALNATSMLGALRLAGGQLLLCLHDVHVVCCVSYSCPAACVH